MSHAVQGHARQTSYGGECWTICGALENGMANHFSILALRIPWTGWKGKKIWYWKMSPLSHLVSNMPLGKSREITPERMTRLSQSGNDAQLWMCLKGETKCVYGESKVWCCKEQYCIGSGNVMPMNQGKLEVVKQEMVRVNIDILGISELKWTGICEFNSNDHYFYYCEQGSLRRNGVALIVNKSVWNAVLGFCLKNDQMILVCFQGKLFNITSIQVYIPNTNAREAEWLYEDLKDLLELIPNQTKPNKTKRPFHNRELESKSKKSKDTWSNRQIWPWSTKWSRSKLTEFCQ